MRILLLVTLFIHAFTGVLFGQAKTRRLPSVINHPSLNVIAPYVSHDGNALLFISDNGQDGTWIVSYTSREVDWSAPAEIPKHINTRLNFLKGYSLSADGKKMYFTSAKSPVVGGYDMFVTELKGGTWTQPENLGAPLNSKLNDGCPSFTTDGNTFYFMRCEKMDPQRAEGCKIFRATRKSNGQWEEPVALPDHINTGNSQAPRIMADSETLIFASDKNGGKGGMDLFITRLKNGTWSSPENLAFVNTEKDDNFVSVAALGRYLLKESLSARNKWEITEFLIPDEFRPKGMMKLEGRVDDGMGKPVPAYISVRDLYKKKNIYNSRPAADGSFFLYLPEGSVYELAVDPEFGEFTFFTQRYDLTTDRISQREKVTASLKRPAAGDVIDLPSVTFQPHTATLEPSSSEELKRLARLIQAHPNHVFEVEVLLKGYREDTIRSDIDLTEIMADSVRTTFNKIDEEGNTVAMDTVITRTFYHNNRTPSQAEAIVRYLEAQGVARKNVRTFVNALPASPAEEGVTNVRVVIRKG